MNGKWVLSKPLYVKMSKVLDNSQLSKSRSPTPSIPSTNVPYPSIMPLPYLNVPTILYLPTVMISTQPNNFPLPIAPPNLQLQSKPTTSVREYSTPPPSSATSHVKRQIYPYTSVKSDD
jgi:hypothetical protein